MISKFHKVGYFLFSKYFPYKSFSCDTSPKINDSIISTLFSHNKKYNPLTILNFNNFDIDKVRKSSKLRNYDVDIDYIKNLQKQYNDVIINISNIEKENAIYLLKYKENDEFFKEKGKNFIANFKSMKKLRKAIYTEMTLKILALPNEIEHTTLTNWGNFVSDCMVTETFKNIVIKGECISDRVEKSFDGKRMIFIDSHISFLKYLMLEHSYDWWISRGYIAVALSDISKTGSVEACNNLFDDSLVGLTNSKLNNENDDINPGEILFLNGSASLEAFCAYLTRTRSTNRCLPMRLVTVGNKYKNVEDEVVQESVLSVFIASKSLEEMEVELRNVLGCLSHYWTNHFDLPVAESSLEPCLLQKYECHRYVLRSGQNDIVANVSVIGDYLSRRLMIQDFSETPLHMIYAEVFNFDSLCHAMKSEHKDVVFRYSSCW